MRGRPDSPGVSFRPLPFAERSTFRDPLDGRATRLLVDHATADAIK